MKLFITIFFLTSSLISYCQLNEFSGTTIDGSKIYKGELKGKVVFFNFWFTTCPPCVAEIPSLNKLQDEFDGKVTFISITFNKPEDVKEFLIKHPLNFTIFSIPQKEIAKMDVVDGYPTNVIIDKSGKIVFHRIGGAMDEHGHTYTYNDWKSAITQALSSN